MIKRLMSLLGSRPSSTPVPAEIETVINPLSDTLLIGMSKYDPLQMPRSQPEKNNTWETMSDMSDDPEVVNITQIEPMSPSSQVNLLSRSDSRLLMMPTTRLILKNGVFSNSPAGVGDLDAHLDANLDARSDCSSLSPIMM